MEIFGRQIGPDRPTYFIAEIGANHDGSLDRALKLIELAADAGADAVKFQHFRAASLVSQRGFEELGKMGHQNQWTKSVYETYEEAEIPLDWTEHLASYAHDHGLGFITTPYSLALADAVEPYVDAYKIGSGDVTYPELISHVAAKRKPVLLATGASDANDVSDAYNAVVYATGGAEDLVLMQCNTDYTGKRESLRHANLRTVASWKDHYVHSLVGLSDHTPTELAVCVAVTLGACVIEKHFTDDPQRTGPDHSFAITPFEWKGMVKNAATIKAALGDGVKRVEENERESRIIQRRALRYMTKMLVGDVLRAGDMVATRPCPQGGLAPYLVSRVVDRTLKRNVEADDLVQMEDFRSVPENLRG